MLSKGHDAGVGSTAELFESIPRGVIWFSLGEQFPIHLGKGCRCGPHRRCKEVQHLLPLSTYLLHKRTECKIVLLSLFTVFIRSLIHSFISVLANFIRNLEAIFGKQCVRKEYTLHWKPDRHLTLWKLFDTCPHKAYKYMIHINIPSLVRTFP